MAAHLDGDCIFCKITQGIIPSEKLLETEHSYAFLDIFPLSAGHCLVIPKYHAQKLHELPEEYHADVGRVLGKVARAVVSGTGCSDYNVLQNNGVAAHQVVPHVHFHIIPKTSEAEGLGIEWPAKAADKEKLASIRESILSHL